MPKPIVIDPAAPVQSLLDALDIKPYRAGVELGVHTANVTSSIRTGARVQLSVLVETARALGVEELRIKVPKKDAGSS